MSHAISHAKPMNKVRQIVMIAALVACVLSIFALFALSATIARPSTLEADPYGHADEAEPLGARHSRPIPFHRDPDMPGRRF